MLARLGERQRLVDDRPHAPAGAEADQVGELREVAERGAEHLQLPDEESAQVGARLVAGGCAMSCVLPLIAASAPICSALKLRRLARSDDDTRAEVAAATRARGAGHVRLPPSDPFDVLGAEEPAGLQLQLQLQLQHEHQHVQRRHHVQVAPVQVLTSTNCATFSRRPMTMPPTTAPTMESAPRG